MYTPLQEDITMLTQSTRDVYCYIDILNKNFKKIGTLDGQVISDSYSFDSQSDVRKTMSLTVHVADSSFLIGRDKKVWYDKYIDVSFGIRNIRTQEIKKYPIGVFLFYDIGYSYSESDRTLSLNLVDRVAELNGDKSGLLSGISTKIEAGSDIRSAMVSTVTQLGKISKYRIDDPGKQVPYDLEFNQGGTVWDVIRELRDLYPGWEAFFDGDTFIFQAYPTATSAPVVLDTGIMKPLVISEQVSHKMNETKNVIELWGECLDSDYYTTTVSMSNSGSATTITATYTGTVGFVENALYGFKASATNVGATSFKLGSNSALPIYGENNAALSAGVIKADKSYVVKYKKSGASGYFYFCGEYQIGAIAKLVSSEPTESEKAADLSNEPIQNIAYVVEPDSPYTIEAIGEMRDVKHGGEYDAIYSDELAMQRAKYDLWLASDLQETIQLECIEVPWLDVNQKIRYRSFRTGEEHEYIVLSKSGSTTGGTMSITCNKFQPLYSWL